MVTTIGHEITTTTRFLQIHEGRRSQYSTDDRFLSEPVIDALSVVAYANLIELFLLNDYFDTDALGTLFDNHEAPNAETLLSFKVDTRNVFVGADGHLRICNATRPTSPEPAFDFSPA